MGLRKVLLKRLRECRDFRALSAYIESVLVLGDETARYLHQLCIAGKYPVTDETLDTLLSIRELYCVFIMKVCAEMDRIMLKSISDKRYDEIDYSIHDFIVWCNGKNHSVGVQSLRKWDEFRKFHDVNNFLKHSSIRSYESLK